MELTIVRDRWRIKMLLASAAFACLSAGAALWRPPRSSAAIRITVAGMPVAAASEALRGRIALPVSLDLPSGKRTLSWSKLGAVVDRARLVSWLAQAGDPSSAMAQRAALAGGALDFPAPIVLDRDASWSAVLRLKDEADRSPEDARVSIATRSLLIERPGIELDAFSTLAALETAAASSAPRIAAKTTSVTPKLSAARIGSFAFDQVLGFFETKYTTDEQHAARTYNLGLAASKLDGHVIMPGETFDFNEVVGPRDEANGYKVATVIAQGELVDGVGGGTCQIAGTLHGAALFAGLDIVQRRPHTRPSFYIKMGLDAMVVYPTVTLTLKNSYDHPVVLHETVRGGVVRAEILGPARTRTVTFVRKIDDVTPFRELARPDPKLASGQRVVAQRGIPGFAIHRYRITRQGRFAVRERWSDTYPPTTQIVRVGTGDAGQAKAEPDAHPEYVADEYLVLMQGPDVDGKGMVEVREAGRSGEYGWTEREGFSREEPRARPARRRPVARR
jgi:vancomycin resistance protein YoaR